MSKKVKSIDEKIDFDKSKFNKNQFLRSKKFKQLYDVICVCMNDDECISSDALSSRIDDFMKGKVL